MLHPDKNPSADANEEFIELREAYNKLSDPEIRKALLAEELAKISNKEPEPLIKNEPSEQPLKMEENLKKFLFSKLSILNPRNYDLIISAKGIIFLKCKSSFPLSDSEISAIHAIFSKEFDMREVEDYFLSNNSMFFQDNASKKLISLSEKKSDDHKKEPYKPKQGEASVKPKSVSLFFEQTDAKGGPLQSASVSIVHGSNSYLAPEVVQDVTYEGKIYSVRIKNPKRDLLVSSRGKEVSINGVLFNPNKLNKNEFEILNVQSANGCHRTCARMYFA